jgi:hypothetical protein
MAPKAKETKRAMEARHIERLAKARWGDNSGYALSVFVARNDYRELRAAVFAVVPGKQSNKNIGPLLDAAVTAVCRVIRRSK